MLGRCLRRQPNIKTTLGQRPVSAGLATARGETLDGSSYLLLVEPDKYY